jgi:RNA polymerase sigma factor (sigma-70 family)
MVKLYRRDIGPEEVRFINNNYEYALKVATIFYKSYKKKHDLEDLISYALEALVDCARVYDPLKGSPTTLIAFRTAGLIRRFIQNESYIHPVRIPVSRHIKYHNQQREAQKKYSKTGQKTSVTPLPVRYEASWIRRFRSKGFGDDDTNDLDFLESDCQSPEQLLTERENCERAISAMESLGKDTREYDVIYRRIYLNQTLQEVGERWGLSRERIRQIESHALAEMRSTFEEV